MIKLKRINRVKKQMVIYYINLDTVREISRVEVSERFLGIVINILQSYKKRSDVLV